MFLIGAHHQVVLLVTAAIVWDYCPADGGACSARVALTSVNYVQIVLSLQTAVLLPLCVAYAGTGPL